ncbi:MAG: Na/Pi cotransporter family protein [Planctomycetota bacterium]|nr:Na/Pi cotransporter family protein [Planctomycetota bacterium]
MLIIAAATDPDWVEVFIQLLGGLSVFLFGMDQMTSSLKTVAGAGLSTLIRKLTTNRFTGALTGALVTAVVQSSSVTTVLLVGFLSAGLMTLVQAVPVIMGANVGSTITAQIVAFDIYAVIPWLITVGFGMSFLSKREKVRLSGSMLMGLGMVFLGMQMMGQATYPLRSYAPFIDMMSSIENPALAILLAAGFTALVQSSSATTALVIMLAGQGFISLPTGIALALGSNIGTCVSALLAALGKPRVALQAATAHVVFNVIGVLIWLPLIDTLASIVIDMSPVYADLSGAERAAAETPRQIANAHTVFNIANTMLLLGFTGLITRLVERMVPIKAEVVPERAAPRYLDPVYFETPAIAVERVRLEVARMGRHIVRTLEPEEIPTVEALESDMKQTNLLYEKILSFAARIGMEPLAAKDAARLERHIAVANQIQAVGDTLVLNVGAIVRERDALELRASPETREMTLALRALVVKALGDAAQALADLDQELARDVMDRVDEVTAQAAAIEERIVSRLAPDDPQRMALYRLETRAVEVMRRIYYFASRIAEAAADDPHEVEPNAELVDEAA